jgi:hypothetical protein
MLLHLEGDNSELKSQKCGIWAGVHNRAEIARQIDYPKATVAENIKKMKARGELEEVIPVPNPVPEPKPDEQPVI